MNWSTYSILGRLFHSHPNYEISQWFYNKLTHSLLFVGAKERSTKERAGKQDAETTTFFGGWRKYTKEWAKEGLWKNKHTWDESSWPHSSSYFGKKRLSFSVWSSVGEEEGLQGERERESTEWWLVCIGRKQGQGFEPPPPPHFEMGVKPPHIIAIYNSSKLARKRPSECFRSTLMDSSFSGGACPQTSLDDYKLSSLKLQRTEPPTYPHHPYNP